MRMPESTAVELISQFVSRWDDVARLAAEHGIPNMLTELRPDAEPRIQEILRTETGQHFLLMLKVLISAMCTPDEQVMSAEKIIRNLMEKSENETIH